MCILHLSHSFCILQNLTSRTKSVCSTSVRKQFFVVAYLHISAKIFLTFPSCGYWNKRSVMLEHIWSLFTLYGTRYSCVCNFILKKPWMPLENERKFKMNVNNMKETEAEMLFRKPILYTMYISNGIIRLFESFRQYDKFVLMKIHWNLFFFFIVCSH